MIMAIFAWTAPTSAITGNILTSALWNSDVRDNSLDLDSRVTTLDSHRVMDY